MNARQMALAERSSGLYTMTGTSSQAQRFHRAPRYTMTAHAPTARYSRLRLTGGPRLGTAQPAGVGEQGVRDRAVPETPRVGGLGGIETLAGAAEAVRPREQRVGQGWALELKG